MKMKWGLFSANSLSVVGSHQRSEEIVSCNGVLRLLQMFVMASFVQVPVYVEYCMAIVWMYFNV